MLGMGYVEEINLQHLLKEIIPEDRLLTNLADLYSYSFDASFGEYLPDIVVQPKTKEEVAEVIKLSNEHKIPVYPRGQQLR